MNNLLRTIENKSISWYLMVKNPNHMKYLSDMIQNEINVLTDLHDYLVSNDVSNNVEISYSTFNQLKELFTSKLNLDTWLKDRSYINKPDEDDYDDYDDYLDDLRSYEFAHYDIDKQKKQLANVINEIQDIINLIKSNY